MESKQAPWREQQPRFGRKTQQKQKQKQKHKHKHKQAIRQTTKQTICIEDAPCRAAPTHNRLK